MQNVVNDVYSVFTSCGVRTDALGTVTSDPAE